jgi:hypothetical protein
VTHAFRDDEHLAGLQRHRRTILEVDLDASVQHEEEVVGVVVDVPVVLAAQRRDHHVVAVDAGGLFRPRVRAAQPRLLCGRRHDPRHPAVSLQGQTPPWRSIAASRTRAT